MHATRQLKIFEQVYAAALELRLVHLHFLKTELVLSQQGVGRAGGLEGGVSSRLHPEDASAASVCRVKSHSTRGYFANAKAVLLTTPSKCKMPRETRSRRVTFSSQQTQNFICYPPLGDFHQLWTRLKTNFRTNPGLKHEASSVSASHTGWWTEEAVSCLAERTGRTGKVKTVHGLCMSGWRTFRLRGKIRLNHWLKWSTHCCGR